MLKNKKKELLKELLRDLEFLTELHVEGRTFVYKEDVTEMLKEKLNDK